MKTSKNFQTTAVNRAARGMLNHKESSTRASSVYGFTNHALHLSAEELKTAWKNASSAVKKSRG